MQDIDETMMKMAENFFKPPAVTIISRRACTLCHTKSKVQVTEEAVLRLDVPDLSAYGGQPVTLESFFLPSEHMSRWKCGHHDCKVSEGVCEGECDGEWCLAAHADDMEVAKVTEYIGSPTFSLPLGITEVLIWLSFQQTVRVTESRSFARAQ